MEILFLFLLALPIVNLNHLINFLDAPYLPDFGLAGPRG